MSDYAVKTSNVSKYFLEPHKKQKSAALQDISMQVSRGQITALIGPDGAGKTTLLRLLCGLLVADEGSIEVLGYSLPNQAELVQENISYMPQKFGLYEDLSVVENMNLYAELHGVPLEERAERFQRLLSMTGLEKFTERLAGKLSGGMKQKLGLACTLVRSPKLLILDEPTVGVDPLSRRELWLILHKLVSEDQLSVLVSTAYMDEAEQCNKVFVLYEGQLVAVGTPEQLRRIAANKCYLLRPPNGMPPRVLQALLLADQEHVIDAVPEGGAVRFIVNEVGTAEGLNVLDKFSLPSPVPVNERLEDCFMILLHRLKQQENTGVVEINFNPFVQSSIEIEVRNLVKKFGDFTAVANTSFTVNKGEIFGLLGPNGAGKTTTFKMLCGLLPATSGELYVSGVDVNKARSKARSKLGYVAQKFSLYAALTVDENLQFYGGAYGLSGTKLKERISVLKMQLGLEQVAAKQAQELPGGYKQRLAMAAALLHEPKILFLDEPTSGIDPLARRDFWKQITALAAQGTTIIITTHFMEEAEYCDRILIQDQGEMLALGTPSAIRCHNGVQLATMDEAFIRIVEDYRTKEQTS